MPREKNPPKVLHVIMAHEGAKDGDGYTGYEKAKDAKDSRSSDDVKIVKYVPASED